MRRNSLMENKKTENINGIDVDVEKAQKLIKRVIVKEKRNLSTKEFSNPEIYMEIPILMTKTY